MRFFNPLAGSEYEQAWGPWGGTHRAGQNWQRYPVEVPQADGSGRTLQYIVSSGGGAHLSASIPRVAVQRVRPDGALHPEVEVTEDAVKLFLWRGHSLARRHVAPRLRNAVGGLAGVAAVLAAFCFGLWFLRFGGQIAAGLLGAVGAALLGCALYVLIIAWTLIWRGGEVDPDVASRHVANVIGDRPARDEAQERDVDPLTARKLRTLLPGPGKRRKFLHGGLFSSLFDFDEPPLLGHFLRLTVEAETLRITCHVVTGFADHEAAPPVGDCIEVPLSPRVEARSVAAPDRRVMSAGLGAVQAPEFDHAAVRRGRPAGGVSEA